MTGYLIETLCPLGWNRSRVAQFRYRDAIEHATDRLEDVQVLAVRILSFKVNEEPVFEEESRREVARP